MTKPGPDNPIAEMAGEQISREQWQRMVNRYAWAGDEIAGSDVLEIACGSGQGLQLLAQRARSVVAGDRSARMLSIAGNGRRHRAILLQFDAHQLPFGDASFDAVLIFEALYYLRDLDGFLAETDRVLRADGKLLIVTANKDLFDFNPSPDSHTYLGVVELRERLAGIGMRTEMFGDTPVHSVSLWQRALRPLKALAARSGLIPKSNRNKLWLKRLVFGRMIAMPDQIDLADQPGIPPTPIAPDGPDRAHKVIFCRGVKTTGYHRNG